MDFQTFLSLSDHFSRQNIAWVLYKYPKSNTLHFVSQKDNTLHLFDPNEKKSGFLLSPFYKGKKVLLVKEQAFYCEYHSEKNKIFSPDNIEENSFEKQRYCTIIENAISAIQQKEFKKVVISREIEIPLQGSLPLTKLFFRMIEQYPETFCYVFSHPKIGNWVAATPETLIRIENQKFLTMALASTQVYNENISWGNKEIEEQNIVTQSIIKDISPIVQFVNTSHTQTIKAGHLAHLCTMIRGEIPPTINPFTLIEKIHPTPAICGFPTKNALSFILEHENHSRQYYSGFCGEVSFENTSPKIDLFVNLRCMSLSENKAYIYVGGGIVENSVVEKEWKETQYKAQIMFSLLKSILNE